MTRIHSWFDKKPHLFYFLMGQAVALLGGAAYGLSYMVTLEARVHTIESGGSAPLNEIKNRITVLESFVKTNTSRIDRVIEVMTRELGKPVDKK
jgi:hypothetical protein